MEHSQYTTRLREKSRQESPGNECKSDVNHGLITASTSISVSPDAPLPQSDSDTALPGEDDDSGGTSSSFAHTLAFLRGCERKRPVCQQERQSQKGRKCAIRFNLEHTRYDVVEEAVCSFPRYTTTSDDEAFDVLWLDTSVLTGGAIHQMRAYQRINHFPGMLAICRKVQLWRNLCGLKDKFPQAYAFLPQTWILPDDARSLRSALDSRGRPRKHCPYLIVKPSSGCQGRGIFISRNADDIIRNTEEACVAQTYVTRPLLVNGYKFDVRVYVLVSSCDPMRIHVFREGLARLCTRKYREPRESNINNTCQHLSNYSINKGSKTFERTDDFDSGSKRTFSSILHAYLRLPADKAASVWSSIDDVVVRTILPIQPSLAHSYAAARPNAVRGISSCFEILGFDILLDEKLDAHLLEVNHSPSFACDSALDHEIKFRVIRDAIRILNLSPALRRKIQRKERREAQRRMLGNLAQKPAREKRPCKKHPLAPGGKWECRCLCDKGSSKSVQSTPFSGIELCHGDPIEISRRIQCYTDKKFISFCTYALCTGKAKGRSSTRTKRVKKSSSFLNDSRNEEPSGYSLVYPRENPIDDDILEHAVQQRKSLIDPPLIRRKDPARRNSVPVHPPRSRGAASARREQRSGSASCQRNATRIGRTAKPPSSHTQRRSQSLPAVTSRHFVQDGNKLNSEATRSAQTSAFVFVTTKAKDSASSQAIAQRVFESTNSGTPSSCNVSSL